MSKPPWVQVEWNWSRVKKLKKLSPGPVSVHPSQMSCSRVWQAKPGCEAKPTDAESRESIWTENQRPGTDLVAVAGTKKLAAARAKRRYGFRPFW
eukprot:scaffold45461_cov62-Phaeocystis_antarctica.AAC.5